MFGFSSVDIICCFLIYSGPQPFALFPIQTAVLRRLRCGLSGRITEPNHNLDFRFKKIQWNQKSTILRADPVPRFEFRRPVRRRAREPVLRGAAGPPVHRLHEAVHRPRRETVAARPPDQCSVILYGE